MNLLRLATVATFALTAALAQHVGAPTDDLDKISVDELFSLQVTSVGRKAQELAKAPGAVFVLTAEDIRRSGATSIPEALQWVPGLRVQRVDGRSWVVSARGAARLFADKILVMIDGRSLYTPLFAGVIWDAIDVPLEQIERIEVVRGAGAVMWGPNAVNGVINIITKKAQDTKGGLVSAAGGNELRGAGLASWGAAPSEKFAFRVWGKFDYRTPAYGSPGLFYFDTYSVSAPVNNLDAAEGRMGFRLDGRTGKKDQWTVEGDLYKMNRQDLEGYPGLAPMAELVKGHSDYEGGSLQSTWTHTSSAGNESEVRFSYQKDDLNYPFMWGVTNDLNFDFQNRRQTGERNEIYWGAGYQQYWDDTNNAGLFGFHPLTSVYRMGNVVLRDEWQMVRGKLLVSAGARVDYISLDGFEYQPSLRFLYTPNHRRSAWVALSRAVRAPSRADRDLLYEGGQVVEEGFPVSVTLRGSPAMRSEVARSLETGYRMQSGQHWSVDISGYWTYYSRLRAIQSPLMPQLTFSGDNPMLALPGTFDNAGSGRSYGGEIWGTWQVRPRWRLMPSYSYLRESKWLPDSTYTLYQWDRVPEDMRHQALLRSQHDLMRNVQLDLMLRARSRDLNYQLPGAVLIDARLGWKTTRLSELSLALQDLTNRNVLETFPEPPFAAIPLRRTFLVKWTQRF